MSCCNQGGDMQAAATLPLASIKYLIDVVRGTQPFSLSQAITAVGEVLKYLGDFFGPSAASVTASAEMQDLATALVAANGEVAPAAFGDNLKGILIQQLLKWLMAKLAESATT